MQNLVNKTSSFIYVGFPNPIGAHVTIYRSSHTCVLEIAWLIFKIKLKFLRDIFDE